MGAGSNTGLSLFAESQCYHIVVSVQRRRQYALSMFDKAHILLPMHRRNNVIALAFNAALGGSSASAMSQAIALRSSATACSCYDCRKVVDITAPSQSGCMSNTAECNGS